MRFMEIRADPLSHFFPTKITEAGTFYCVAPPGLAPEISDLFLFPAAQGAGQKRKGPAQNERASKRQRLESEPVDDVEQARGRVGSVAPSMQQFEGDGGGFDGFGDESGFLPNDESIPIDDFQFPVDDSLHIDQQPAASSPSRAPPGDLFDESARVYAEDDCPVAMFDTQPMTQDSTTASPQKHQDGKEKEETVNKDGYSRNTVKAIGLLRHELKGQGQAEELGFGNLTENVRSFNRLTTYILTFFNLGNSPCCFFLLL